MDVSGALCWWLLSAIIAVIAGMKRSPFRLAPRSVHLASPRSPPMSPPHPHTAMFFDYADDDQIKMAEISSIIGEVSSMETRVKEAQILRIVVLGAVLAFIIFILYHIFCRVFCAFGL
ncbi:uncharacterized protein ACNLHF_026432 [Anomaloglossus baeobatrachus]